MGVSHSPQWGGISPVCLLGYGCADFGSSYSRNSKENAKDSEKGDSTGGSDHETIF